MELPGLAKYVKSVFAVTHAVLETITERKKKGQFYRLLQDGHFVVAALIIVSPWGIADCCAAASPVDNKTWFCFFVESPGLGNMEQFMFS